MTDLELQLLTILRDSGKLHGLEMGQRIEQRFERLVGAGSLYRTLHRLEHRGLVRATWEEEPKGHRGPPRRYYEITGTGAGSLEEGIRNATASLRRLSVLPKT